MFFKKEWFFDFELIFQRKDESVNLFHANVLFLHPLKTSENLRFSHVFRGYRNRILAWKELMVCKFAGSHIDTLRCSVKKVFLKILQYSQKNTCARVPFLIKLQAWTFIKKETLVQVFSCEFFKNSFFL